MAEYDFPTSFGQRWMWLLAEMDAGEPTYNIPWALWLDGPLDVSALAQAWDAVLVRHEALRTTFRNESGVPVQVVHDELTAPPLAASSVEQLAAGERKPAALAMVRDLACAPFDLAADLPMLPAAQLDELIVGRNRQPFPGSSGGLSGSSPSDGTAGGDEVDIRDLLRASPSRVIDGGEDLPMSEVCDRAGRLARTLADRGVGPDTLVGICVERGVGMLTALLAIWWAGGAYVPLDPGFPEARLAAMTTR